jgi:hypothetical protein
LDGVKIVFDDFLEGLQGNIAEIFGQADTIQSSSK